MPSLFLMILGDRGHKVVKVPYALTSCLFFPIFTFPNRYALPYMIFAQLEMKQIQTFQ